MIIEFVLFFLMHHDCFLTLILYIVHISFYVIWTDMSENKLFVIVIVIHTSSVSVIKDRLCIQTAPGLLHTQQCMIYCSVSLRCVLQGHSMTFLITNNVRTVWLHNPITPSLFTVHHWYCKATTSAQWLHKVTNVMSYQTKHSESTDLLGRSSS